jgi:hypothetical protein
MSLNQVFNKIYTSGSWGDGSSTKPLSGSGSYSEHAQPYVEYVRRIIKDFNLKRVLDIGHGDFEMWQNWQFPGIEYLGVDISDKATRLAQTKYQNSNLVFKTLDFTQLDDVPLADILITKDCLQHLPNQTILMLFQKFSSYEHLIICNDLVVPIKSRKRQLIFDIKFYLRLRSRINALANLKNPFFLVQQKNNDEIDAGDFHGINLEIAPFVGALLEFDLIDSFDYDGPKRVGITKRVYFFSKNSNSQNGS